VSKIEDTKIINKNYGSIAHLSTSKLTQQADKKISAGQETILTKKARDWKDLIIVTEKLDGSNVGILKINGELKTIQRKGFSCSSSPFEMHRIFDKWVNNRYETFGWIPEGWRIAGEWMIQSHGTIYDITNESPFVAFDIFNDKNERINYLYFLKLCTIYGIQTTGLLHIGQPISIRNSIKLLGDGIYGNPEKPEGFVYRVERNSKVDFLAKWVRHDKEDGKYLSKENPICNNGWEGLI
jgi:hypothetical protein